MATHTFPKVNLIQPACALFFGNTMDIYTTAQDLLVGNSEDNPVPAHVISAYGLIGFTLGRWHHLGPDKPDFPRNLANRKTQV